VLKDETERRDWRRMLKPSRDRFSLERMAKDFEVYESTKSQK
jgi:hypothetical protein